KKFDIEVLGLRCACKVLRVSVCDWQCAIGVHVVAGVGRICSERKGVVMSFKIITSAMAVLLCGLSAIAVQTTHQASGRASSAQLDTGEVIRRFAAAESENRIARNSYTFTQDFQVLTLGEAGSVTGKFHRVSDIVYDDRGQRVEKITFFPPSTLYELQISDEDMQDLAGVQPFALATEDLGKYNIVSLGKEKVDELNTYVFDVKPKTF